MKTLSGVLALLVALSACSDSKPSAADADVVVADAPPGICNASQQTGCAATEKCANIIVEERDFPAENLTVTGCVPDGTVAVGDVCSQGAAGQTTGYDDCLGGLSCLLGTCTPICSTVPDSCRDESEPPLEGEYCSVFSATFDENTGLCIAACDPSADTVTDGEISNDSCPAGQGCFLQTSRGVAACSSQAGPKQNEEALPFINGCASGFGPHFNNPAGGSSWCTRYCTPDNSHTGNLANIEGTAQKCGLAALAPVGGTNAHNDGHECRFLQTMYGDSDSVPTSVGVCIPAPTYADSWGSCEVLDWASIKVAWNAAVEGGGGATEANAAVDAICLEDDPENPGMQTLKATCLGMFRGCLSFEFQDQELMSPAGQSPSRFSRNRWADTFLLRHPDVENWLSLVEGGVPGL